MRSNIFGNIDFAKIASNPEFNETSVRSAIIDPLLRQLGYSVAGGNLAVNKTVNIKIGSQKNVPYYAGYVLTFGNCFVCVIEAKVPDKKISEDEAIVNCNGLL